MATNYATASYDEMYDFGTQAGKVSILGIHTPSVEAGVLNRATPFQMLRGFFTQFRKFRYKGCRVSVVPAAQLPADPLQVSFEAGQPTIDPRDLLNPILFHGCHGESLAQALNSIYGDDAAKHSFTTPSIEQDDKDFSESLVANEYYAALSDRTWRKFGVQTPFRLPELYPLVHKVSALHPMLGEMGGMTGYPDDSNGKSFYPNLVWQGNVDGIEGQSGATIFWQKFMTNGVARLGWLPTTDFAAENSQSTMSQPRVPSPLLPKIFMGVLMFPPSYTQELYFRMYITHYFEFKEFQGISLGDNSPANPYYNNLPDIGGGAASSIQSSSLEFLDGSAPEITTQGVH